MKCLILDDEPIALEILKDYIAKVPCLELSGAFRNPVEAVHYLQTHAIDLVFLDIQMPGLSGFQFLRTLSRPPMVIFTTAYAEHAVASYEHGAIDYLLKPIEFDRFLKAVNKARDAGPSPARKRDDAAQILLIKSGKKRHKVALDEILYIQAADNYVAFFTRRKEILSLMTMKEARTLLPPAEFVRVHKSYFVNLKHVEVIEDDAILIGGRKIPIGHSYREEFYRWLQSVTL